MTRIIILLVLLFASDFANAESAFMWKKQGGNVWYSTANAACAATAASQNDMTFKYHSITSDGATLKKGRCYGVYTSLPNGDPFVFVNTEAWLIDCPAGQIPQGSNGTCGAPPPPACAKGSTVNVVYKVGPAGSTTAQYGPPRENASDGECAITITDVVDCYKGVDGAPYCRYTGIRTGENLKPGAADQATPVGGTPPAKAPTDEPVKAPPIPGRDGSGCPGGTVMAGYNSSGTPMCVGTGTTPSNAPAAPPTKTTTKTEPTADGGSAQTTTTVKTNTDGSTTTTVVRVVTAPDGSVSQSEDRTTSNNTAGGAGRETPDKPSEEQNFCKQNPNLSVCRESTVSGTCGQISCMGDAIQCATLRAAAAMQCKQAEDETMLKNSTEAALGNSILNGSDPMAAEIGAAIKGSEVDLSKANLDQAGFIGGGSCFPNKTFMVSGRSVTMDFTTVCSNIQPLRGVVLACAFIVAYLIVSRSVLSS